MTGGMPTLLGRALMALARMLLALRYRIEVRGLREIATGERKRILFLSSHPALIDPPLLVSILYSRFAPRSLADEYQISFPVLGRLIRRFGARALPNLERSGLSSLDATKRALAETIDGLRAGENLLLYPAGRLKRGHLEEIGAASAVEAILAGVPDVRVVLIRQHGLWGSSFSYGFRGQAPRFGPALGRGLGYLALNAFLLIPRRRVTVEIVEPEDFPRNEGRMAVNRWLEDFFNAGAPRNTYVPYGFWERGGTRELPDPEFAGVAGDAGSVPPATREHVLARLAEISGRADPVPSDSLTRDLGMDSLATAEIVLWIEKEFGHSVGTPESLRTVGDVLLAAAGRGVSSLQTDLTPPGRAWVAGSRKRGPVAAPTGETITEAFLRQAAVAPDRVILADQISGTITYRRLVLGCMLLKPLLEELPGARIGIMLPASSGAGLLTLATLFAGKTPVMVNWTTGMRNLVHSLDLVGVEKVVTAKALLARLTSLGLDLSPLRERFVFVDDLRARMGLGRKLAALAASRLSWSALSSARPPDTAVILFTSGSESLPKAVPLSHANILTNIRDVLRMIEVDRSDALIGMLPPFHSFGIVVTVLLPLTSGLRTVYHPNPTEAAILARILESYRVTMLVGTPTFLAGIVRLARPGQLDSLRMAVTGAESCPAAVYESLRRSCPGAAILEGYGITECSPIVSANPLASPVPGSIGRLLPSVEGVVVSLETGARVPPGETGMLLVRGPSIFSGYLAYDGESPFVELEGKSWYRTGDLVRQRPDGVLFFEGRLKRFVKLGGEMISLPAIESVLMPYFASERDEGPPIAVLALGQAESPEIVLFTVKDATRARANEILKQAGLSPLHNVRDVIRVNSIPVLGTGKTDYRALKESRGR
jgi:acyl-CoA synthetase (AMP-forming)/AMP-acid ligase II/1-acyl-sn-glycerol-3-phosphate acyltransferase/acyl carrier protein